MNKPISHFNRLNNPKEIKVSIPREDRFTFTQVDEKDDSLGRVMRVTKKVLRKNPYKDMKASDFALENLQAVGATLKPCCLQSDKHETLSSIEQGLSNLAQKVDNDNSNINE